ncbi:MAG TPA: hypothetical protein PLD54_01050 [Candidatus Levybacteria bacterium]|nr:hypothetical protein [Candidatus Levybacteria bacterium]
MKVSKLIAYIFESNTRIIPIVGILLLAITVPITLNVIEQNQDNRQQAAPFQSIQDEDPGANIISQCSDFQGASCVTENDVQPEFSCFQKAESGIGVKCPAAGEICCIEKNVSMENSTCTDSGKKCDYRFKDLKECEDAFGVGNCSIFPDLHCVNQNKCFEIASSATSQQCPGQCHSNEQVCEDNNTGKDCVANSSYTCSQTGTSCFDVKSTYVPQGQPCPDKSGNFSCGFGTSDTQCPVCSPVATCSTDNYSIASCSGAAVCTEDANCANNPPSCPAGQTGQVVCQKLPNQSQGSCKTVSCQ